MRVSSPVFRLIVATMALAVSAACSGSGSNALSSGVPQTLTAQHHVADAMGVVSPD